MRNERILLNDTYKKRGVNDIGEKFGYFVDMYTCKEFISSKGTTPKGVFQERKNQPYGNDIVLAH